MPVRFADVTGIHRPRGRDPRDRRKETLEGCLDQVHLASARGRARARDDGAAVGDDRGVLDEAAVRMPGVRGQDREREPAAAERFAVALMLQAARSGSGAPSPAWVSPWAKFSPGSRSRA